MTDHPQRHTRKGRSAEIHLGESMASWKNDIKFPAGTHFLFETLLFMEGEDNDLELQAQGHEEWGAVLIGFEFPRGLVNSVTALSTVVVVLGSPIGPYLGADLFVSLYSGFAPAVWGATKLSNIIPADSRSMGLTCPRNPN
jgi:hypothetical protein